MVIPLIVFSFDYPGVPPYYNISYILFYLILLLKF